MLQKQFEAFYKLEITSWIFKSLWQFCWKHFFKLDWFQLFAHSSRFGSVCFFFFCFFVLFVFWDINFHGLFHAKSILQEEQQWCDLTHSCEYQGVHFFPNGICPKVNVIAQLEFEFAYFDYAVYSIRTPPTVQGFNVLPCNGNNSTVIWFKWFRINLFAL